LLWSSPSQPKQVIPRSRLYAQILPQTLIATNDAFVQGGAAAETNFGGRSVLYTKNASGARLDREAYLKFDLSALDSSSISAAKLRVFGRLSNAIDTNLVTALYAAPGAGWGETSITWNARPATSSKALATATVSNNAGQWYEFDISSYLRQQHAAGRSILTFALRNLTSSSAYTIWHAREAVDSLPQILVWT
jgi:hypothetical protein